MQDFSRAQERFKNLIFEAAKTFGVISAFRPPAVCTNSPILNSAIVFRGAKVATTLERNFCHFLLIVFVKFRFKNLFLRFFALFFVNFDPQRYFYVFFAEIWL